MANHSETAPTNFPNLGGGYIITFQFQKKMNGSISAIYCPNSNLIQGSSIVAITTNSKGAWGSGWFTYGQIWIRLYSNEMKITSRGPVYEDKLTASFYLNTPTKVPNEVVIYGWSYAFLLSLSKSDDPESLLPPGWKYTATIE